MQMIDLFLKDPDGQEHYLQVKEGTSVPEVIAMGNYPHAILSCRINNVNMRLDTVLTRSCHLDLLDLRDNYANMSFQSSLIFLYMEAVHRVLGKDAHITVLNSLSKGLYTTIRASLSNENVAMIEQVMHDLVKADVPFREEKLSKQQMMDHLKQLPHSTGRRLRLMQTSDSLDSASLCRFESCEDLFYVHLLPSSRYCVPFELRRYRNGVLLRFPLQSDPDVVEPFEEQKLLYDAFAEETHWEHLLSIDYAGDLNACMKGDYQEVVMLSEALHEKKITEIAQRITEEKKRLVLIAGPSSSGKTSFARRLCIQLRVCGLHPLYLGTDDYFKNRDELIPDANGSLDFESLDAVDTDLFTRQMNDLLAGKKVDLPTFDFITGKKVYGQRITSLEPGQPVVMEGIHGLNPALTGGIPEDEKFRIYISPLTSISIDPHHRVPTTDARMLRRMVRDARTRNRSAAMTLHDWASVRRGEEKWIFPYCDQADAFFNSSLVYEIAALKKYADPLLKQIDPSSDQYPEAQRMIEFLKFFVTMPDDACIANNSILREFIGGSILVD